jgi:hypothetical protein
MRARVVQQVAQLGEILRTKYRVPYAAGNIHVLEQGDVIRLYDPTRSDLFISPANHMAQRSRRCLVFAANPPIALRSLGWFLPISSAHVRMHAPGWRDLQHIVHPEARPAANAFEIVFEAPGFWLGVKVLLTHGVPVLNFPSALPPAQMRRNCKPKALAVQGYVIRLFMSDGCQPPFAGIHHI